MLMYNLYILELIVVCFLCVSCNPGWGEDTSRDKYGGHFTTYNGPSSITLSKDNEQKAKVKWYQDSMVIGISGRNRMEDLCHIASL